MAELRLEPKKSLLKSKQMDIFNIQDSSDKTLCTISISKIPKIIGDIQYNQMLELTYKNPSDDNAEVNNALWDLVEKEGFHLILPKVNIPFGVAVIKFKVVLKENNVEFFSRISK